jgi:hypothetical protein
MVGMAVSAIHVGHLRLRVRFGHLRQSERFGPEVDVGAGRRVGHRRPPQDRPAGLHLAQHPFQAGFGSARWPRPSRTSGPPGSPPPPGPARRPSDVKWIAQIEMCVASWAGVHVDVHEALRIRPGVDFQTRLLAHLAHGGLPWSFAGVDVTARLATRSRAACGDARPRRRRR